MLKSDSIIEKGFFGRRKGRPLRNAQATLMEKALPELSLALPTEEALDLEALFPGFEKVRVEIGFGGGEHLLAQAKANPHTAFIGCEPFVNGVATLLKGIQEEGLQNIKIYTEDGRDLLRALPQHAIEHIYILFPDPWPKKRHHKRRIVNSETLKILATLLKRDGVLTLATDHDDYLEWMEECLNCTHHFEIIERGDLTLENRPPNWPVTRYERKAHAAERGCVFLRTKPI